MTIPSAIAASAVRRISPKAASRLAALDPAGTVFAEYTALAIRHNAVNLGQGFPTLPVADFVVRAVADAAASNGLLHQYTRSEGHPRLVKTLASFYGQHLGRSLDPLAEIVTTVGATEAIYSTIQAFVNPGDEVILMQPFYDSYPASIMLAGGKPVPVSLRPPSISKSSRENAQVKSSDWVLDFDEIRKSITPKTKIIMINNPQNPLGKVFTRDELQQVSAIAKEHDLLVIADEVYETLAYSDSVSPFIKFASLPGMYERTITLGSVGKAFGVTGWKIGWAIAPPELARSVWLVHQFVPFAVATPLQEAVSIALEEAQKNGYFEKTAKEYESLRNLLFDGLQSLGFQPMRPDGGYFIICDVSEIQQRLSKAASANTNSANPSTETSSAKTWTSVTPESAQLAQSDFSRFLTTEVGVTSIPMSAFYHRGDDGKTSGVDHLVRFAFCKDRQTIQKALDRMQLFFA